MRTSIAFIASLILFGSESSGQATGDFKSVASGFWDNASVWTRWDGNGWISTSVTPASSNSVYLDSGAVVSLTSDASCNDLNICVTPSSEHLVTGSHRLNVNGKFRAYGGTAPGTATTSLPGTTSWINTSAGGKISVTGTSRQLTVSGEWGANPPGWVLEIALPPGQTATVSTNLKAARIVVSSGTLSLPAGDLRADSGSSGSGSILVGSGATLSMGGGIISRTGTASTGFVKSFTVNGRLSYAGSTVGTINANTIGFNGAVEYSGAGSQTFVQKTPGGGGAAAPDLYQDLIIGGSGLKSLSMTTTVRGSLTFAGGAGISMGSHDLIIGGSVAGAATGSACITNGTGGVRKLLGAGSSFQFPLSTDGTDFNPLTIEISPADTGTPDTFTVAVKHGVNPSSPNNASAVQRTWTVREVVPGGNHASLTFQWISSQEGTAFGRAAGAVWAYDGSKWIEASPGHTDGQGPYTLTSTSIISSFGSFIIGNDGALPITLASFVSLPLSDKGVPLQWSTISEVNSFAFEVERANELGGPYKSISSLIPGHGTTNIPQTYTYVDCDPLPGRSWYRLKQIDLDGITHYFSVLEVSLPIRNPQIELPNICLPQNYPNPFNASTIIIFHVDSGAPVTLRVFNTLGQVITTLYGGMAVPGLEYHAVFNGSTLPSGMYFSRLESGGISEVRKLILVR